MITYQVESFAECIDEIKPLLRRHYREICSHPDILVFNPDYETYEQLGSIDMLRIMTVRDEGYLAGYFITMIMPHLHYSDTIYGLNDILYIDHDYRGSTVGYRLFVNAMNDLKDNCGVTVLCVHMKIKHQFRRLLEKLEFKQTEENWEVIL